MRMKGELPFSQEMVAALTALPRQRYCAALCSAVMLTLAFPPLSWNLLAWVAFIPLLMLPQPFAWYQRLLTGYVFGYVHWALSLLWLNEIGFGAGVLLAIYCGLFPMAWYCFFCMLTRFWKDPALRDVPGSGLRYIGGLGRQAVLALVSSCGWVGLEWLRGWLFTGFPWNDLGVVEYAHPSMIQIASWTGVFGISFLLMMVNHTIAIELVDLRSGRSLKGRMRWHCVALAVVALPVVIAAVAWRDVPAEKTLPVLVVQGNMPQRLQWTREIMLASLERYSSLTRQGMAECLAQGRKPELIVWPETAIPAPLENFDYRTARNPLMREMKTRFLIGATRYVRNSETDLQIFNSVFLLDTEAPYEQCVFSPVDYILDYYDKVHRVPYGEYTPGASLWPKLREILGIGMDLTPGKAFNCLTLPCGPLGTAEVTAKTGINICFEDAFPEISRAFTQNGAQLLMTITNDAWFNQSAGAAQHASQMVFRAVENRRPFLRCGSNSHSYLVSPHGVVSQQLRDEANDSDFVAATRLYEVPVYELEKLGTTFYTRYGNVMAVGCFIVALAAWGAIVYAELHRRRERLKKLTIGN